jgi:hypothetical protein
MVQASTWRLWTVPKAMTPVLGSGPVQPVTALTVGAATEVICRSTEIVLI